MPSYNQIGLYFQVQEGSGPIRQKLRELCADLGWLTAEIEASLQQLVWIVEDGWVDTRPESSTLIIPLGELSVTLRFIAMGRTPTDTPYLSWHVLMDSRAIIDDVLPHEVLYKPGVLADIWNIMQRMSRHGSHYGVFWSYEGQESSARTAIIKGNPQKYWDFELAIFRRSTQSSTLRETLVTSAWNRISASGWRRKMPTGSHPG